MGGVWVAQGRCIKKNFSGKKKKERDEKKAKYNG